MPLDAFADGDTLIVWDIGESATFLDEALRCAQDGIVTEVCNARSHTSRRPAGCANVGADN